MTCITGQIEDVPCILCKRTDQVYLGHDEARFCAHCTIAWDRTEDGMTLNGKSVILTDDAVDGELPEDILGRMGILAGNVLDVFAFEGRLQEVMSIPEVLFTESEVSKFVDSRKQGQYDPQIATYLTEGQDMRTGAIHALNAIYKAVGWPTLFSPEGKVTQSYSVLVQQDWPAMLKGKSILQLIAHARYGGKVTKTMEEAAASSPLPLGQAILTYDTIKALTQEWFTRQGYEPTDELEVYRGLRLPANSSIPDSADFEDNPLAPWTTEKAIALSFALSWPGRKAIVLSTWVKVEDIFSLGVAGFGSFEEAECVLESGKIGRIKVEVMEVSGEV